MEIKVSLAESFVNANREQFDAFEELLLFYNKKFNLTAITEHEEVFYKHFVDSVAGADLFPEHARVAEVGSGAGFPSIPLMIVRRDLQFLLIESTGKKCEFLRTAVRELDLAACVLQMRAEEAARGMFREDRDVCCARAVARLNTLSEYCLPLVKQGGKMIAYKGAREELKEAENAIRLLGGGEAKTYHYELPKGYGARSLVEIKKIRRTPLQYPRGNGKEVTSPIV